MGIPPLPPFPPYMNAQDSRGLRSHGPGVTMLQTFLLGIRGAKVLDGGFSVAALDVNGFYDDATVTWVKALQQRLGFRGDAVDGNFGPETRLRAIDRCGFDLADLMQYFAQHHVQYAEVGGYAQADGSMVVWPPQNASPLITPKSVQSDLAYEDEGTTA